jgi:ubiquinone/menaquinone biosynthesis C-methylase UbiE
MSSFNDYDGIAPAYDFLVRLVFGSRLFEAQLHHLPRARLAGSRVLIIGGGTGRIIGPVMETLLPEQLVYMEKSAAMLDLSRKNTPEKFLSQVNFVLGTQENLSEKEKFDTIITCFFFDQFELPLCREIHAILYALLKKGGCWIWADFVQPQRFSHKVLLRLMLSFFAWSVSLGTRELPDIYPVFERSGLRLEDKCAHYGGFIETALFRKG